MVIQKNDKAQIQVSVSNYKGKDYVHIREYYLSESNTWLPTKKGVAFDVSFLDQVIYELTALRNK
jgi:hypothetical protein